MDPKMSVIMRFQCIEKLIHYYKNDFEKNSIWKIRVTNRVVTIHQMVGGISRLAVSSSPALVLIFFVPCLLFNQRWWILVMEENVWYIFTQKQLKLWHPHFLFLFQTPFCECKKMSIYTDSRDIQCSICRGSWGFNPLWCLSTPQVFIDLPGLVKNTLLTPPLVLPQIEYWRYLTPELDRSRKYGEIGRWQQ